MNAKQELLEWFINPRTIKCCEIRMEYYTFDDDTSKVISLKEGYTEEEYEEFLNKLDFDYDAGYGSQHMYGTVWLTEPGVWMERREYDGSEWWELFKCPMIPDNLKK